MPRSLLLVHGALGSASQMATLADACRTALAPSAVRVAELSGHGSTPRGDAPFAMPSFAAELGRTAAALRAETGASPVLFGYSMGGYAGLLAESRHPGTFGGIVTLGTMLEWTPAIAEAAAGRLDPAVITAKVPAFGAQLAERHAGAGGWERVLADTAALLRALGATPMLSAETLRRVQCPVEFLVGERDDSVSFEATAALAAGMPDARATLLPGVPHPIEKVPAPAVVNAVRAQLER